MLGRGVMSYDTWSIYLGLSICQVLYERPLNFLTPLLVVKTMGSGLGLPEFKCLASPALYIMITPRCLSAVWISPLNSRLVCPTATLLSLEVQLTSML